jgi:hypothetical protein
MNKDHSGLGIKNIQILKTLKRSMNTCKNQSGLGMKANQILKLNFVNRPRHI